MLSRTLTVLALSATLSACGALSARVDTKIKPERCPDEAAATVPATPLVPDGAGFPMPLTAAERAAVGLYTPWLTALGADNAEKTRRLVAVKAWCDARK